MAGKALYPFLSPAPKIPIITATPNHFRLRPRPLLASPSPPPTSTPGRHSRRSNRLRPKLLKTLTKPAPLPEPPTPPPPPPGDEGVIPHPLEQAPSLSPEEDFAASETVGPALGYVGKFSVLKFGGYLLGVLLFQTISAVLVLGVSQSVKEEQDSYKGRTLANGEAVRPMDEEEVERRVREIREMARKAREREIREKAQGNEGISEIEKEVAGRLSKVEKVLDKEKREGGPVLEGLLADEDEGNDDGIERFVFDKKRSFRSAFSGSRSKAKGFSGLTTGNESDLAVDLMGKDAGALQEASGTSPPVETEKTLQQSNSERLDPKIATSELSHQITAKSAPVNGMKATDSAKRKETSDARVKQPDVLTDLWWFQLPYVLAILMSRGPEQDEGLFVLRLNSAAGGEEGAAYALAFEDRTDANNFCILLESYFDDLDEFSAHILPLSTKELQESLKSQSQKVLVVKKGQVKLYAGQPFAEVESALRSLLE